MARGSAPKPARSLALLWGTQDRSRHGPRPGLQRDEIVSAAIEIADHEGLGAVSMRRVAERLGIGTMSLYTYVPGKAELVDLMLDAAYAELSMTNSARPAGWRARLEAVAQTNWDLYQRHAWILQLPTVRPGLGPHALAKYDHELQALDGIGLTELEMDSALNLVLGHVEGVARRWSDALRLEQETGTSLQQWWTVNGPTLTALLADAHFPTAARVGAVAGETYGGPFSPAHALDFGLARVLDGIEVLVAERRGLRPTQD